MAKKNFKNPAAAFISEAENEVQTNVVKEEQQDFSIPKGYRLQKEFKTERMQLLIRPTTKAAIKEAAAERGKSMNDLVNEILDEFAERIQK